MQERVFPENFPLHFLSSWATDLRVFWLFTDKGYGKQSSAYEYRKTNRGGVGIANMQLSDRNGSEVVASFPIVRSDQLMLVTDKGKLIRCPVNDIRIAGRQTQGVTLFNVSEEEKVVSVAKLEENE